MNWADIMQVVLLLVAIIAIFFKLPDPEVQVIKDFVMAAVKAAEMLFPNPKSGAAKKQEVVAMVKKQYGHLPDPVVNTLVEAAVYDLKRGNS